MPTSTAPQTHPENNNHRGDTIADLASSLLSSPKQSHHHTEGNNQENSPPSPSAARAMSHTGAWKPALDRRQSWSAQEYKHDLFKRQYMAAGPGEEAGKGGGFSEV